MYLRWVIDQSPHRESWNTVAELKEKERELKKEAIRLRKYLLELHQSRGHSGQRKLSEATIDDSLPEDCSHFRRSEDSSSESPGEIDHPLKYI